MWTARSQLPSVHSSRRTWRAARGVVRPWPSCRHCWRRRLRPETVAVGGRNLRIIDAAIRESRAALERDPGNAELRQLFAAAYRQKVELLRWATRVATSS